MTGDWIIFAKHEGQNFYLGLATHEEAMPQVADQLYDKLRGGSAWEFPFLFECSGQVLAAYEKQGVINALRKPSTSFRIFFDRKRPGPWSGTKSVTPMGRV
jgi:hypothetical protein